MNHQVFIFISTAFWVTIRHPFVRAHHYLPTFFSLFIKTRRQNLSRAFQFKNPGNQIFRNKKRGQERGRTKNDRKTHFQGLHIEKERKKERKKERSFLSLFFYPLVH